MKYVWRMTLILIFCKPFVVSASIDTLKDTSQIYDAIIYGYENCVQEVTGEDCKRYNGGRVVNMSVGNAGIMSDTRVIFSFPGWNSIMPDSSEFLIHCNFENDTDDRKFFLYPILKQIYEGTENSYNVGGYPEPDSGVTWLHAWLDIGDLDSLKWNSPGGDYITAVACTTIVTETNQYFSFKNFNRILNYWDTSGNHYGMIMINENVFPVNSAKKTFRSSEGVSSTAPMLILYYPDSASCHRRRDIINYKNNRL